MIRYLLVLLVIMTIEISFAQKDTIAPVVLELFTSQGCSSCPPADILLESIKNKYKDENVFVLSYHVDYWNRLGWKDPYSKKEFSEYQREYAIVFESSSIYTPQLVVNGSEHFTGSNQKKLQAALNTYGQSAKMNTIKFTPFVKYEKDIVINYSIEGEEFYSVTFALVIEERKTTVNKGENINRILKNTNIVANRKVVNNKATSTTISVPNWVNSKDKLSIIGYTQNRDLKITGTSKMIID